MSAATNGTGRTRHPHGDEDYDGESEAPPPRQMRPLDQGLHDLDPSIVYIPELNYAGHDKAEAVPTIGGVSSDYCTSLIYDTVYSPRDGLAFAVLSGNQITYHPYLICGRTTLVPPSDPHGFIKGGHVSLASWNIDSDIDLDVQDDEFERDLDDEIDDYLHRYMDTSQFNRDLCRNYVKLTWVFDRFNALPYLRILGPYGSAKTRLAEVTGRICNKYIGLSGATSAAPIFRLADLFHGTLFLDEADFKNSDMFTDIIKVLNNGYKRGQSVMRCDKDNEVIAFDPYGPKILTSRGRFTDTSLESRCITIEIPAKQFDLRKDISCQMPDEFYVEAQAIRNKLLYWRFITYHKIQIDESKLRGSLEPRLVEICGPLFAVSGHEPEFQTNLKKFMDKTSTERRRESPEAIFVQAVQELIQNKNTKAQKAGVTLGPDYTLRVADVAQIASQLRTSLEPEAARLAKPGFGDDQQFYNAKRAGQILRSLGFRPEHTRRGAEFTVSLTTVAGLVERYGSPDATPVNQRIARAGFSDNIKGKEKPDAAGFLDRYMDKPA